MKVLLTPGILLALPMSMLLILSAAVCSGAAAAVWFTILTGRAARSSAPVEPEADLEIPISLLTTIIETDAPPELAEKLG